uniref:aminoacyl-histidine dipeptidase n=1 Tax=Ndongobacter massiliensis TaxID=1871025 RepID=UPI0009317C14|nr:aminoacyl-histidine dipeptidase [Ndongobacter massiliensis]
MGTYEALKPHKVFEYFYKINQVPRGSGEEEAIGRALEAHGRKMGLETKRDSAGNVVLRKPASPGYENAPTVTIQGHMDMVCQKTPESTHDFSKDPIAMEIDGDWLHAKDTTLGADDGIGVAMGLALLDEDFVHPPLEVLVTTAEETGMDGAIGLAPDFLTGSYLLNIDSEEEGFVTVSCAGGSTGVLSLPLQRKAPTPSDVFSIRVDGMRGGHSGMEILKVSHSAIKVLTEFLLKLDAAISFDLHAFHAGEKHNAIPNEAEAIVSVPKEQVPALLHELETLRAAQVEAILKFEPDIRFAWKEIQTAQAPLTDETKTALLNLLQLLPHGVNTMMADRSVVESSDNLASAHTDETDMTMILSVRSATEARRAELQDKVRALAQLFGAACHFRDGYPAWEYRADSPLRERFLAQYREMFGKEAEVLIIHAGLECALFAQTHPHLDMISFGPDIKGAHTTRERLSIGSTERTYELLKAIVTSIAKEYVDESKRD